MAILDGQTHAETVAQSPVPVRRNRPRPSALRIVAWAVVAVALLLRLRIYLFDRDLFLDEAMLATNLFQRSFAGLAQVLDYNQGAPLGFLAACKLAVLWLGEADRVLRLLPFLASLASVFLFYAIARRILDPFGLVCALVLFAVGHDLVNFSGQFKQYSSDVALGLLIAWLALRALDGPPNLRMAVPLALAGAAAVWLSHAGIIVAAGMGLTLGAAALLRREWPRVGVLVGIGAVWTVSLAGAYWISLRHLTGNRFLLRFWDRGFMPFPPTSAGDLRWYLEQPFEVLRSPVGLTFAGLGALAFAAGAVTVHRDRPARCWLLLSPIAITLALSALHQYPFQGRLILFLSPFFLLFIGAGLGWLRRHTRADLRAVGLLTPALLLLHPVVYAAYDAIHPPRFAEIRSALDYLAKHKESDDAVYVHYRAEPLLEIYGPPYGLEPRYVTGTKDLRNWQHIPEDVRRFAHRPRVWFLLSYAAEDELDNRKFFLTHLDLVGKRVQAHETYLAGVYLYDLSAYPLDPSPSTGADAPMPIPSLQQ